MGALECAARLGAARCHRRRPNPLCIRALDSIERHVGLRCKDCENVAHGEGDAGEEAELERERILDPGRAFRMEERARHQVRKVRLEADCARAASTKDWQSAEERAKGVTERRTVEEA